MKKILIAGADSYIGTSFQKYLGTNYPDEYIIDVVDMSNENWRNKSFSEYDSVLHVAGIVHQRESKKNMSLYYLINRDLAVETAKKAKNEGVRHFMYLSTMSVYGMDSGIISKETPAKPKNNYGRSKLEAEQIIQKLSDETFKVCILRPPMVYGKGCKGNFNKLCTLIKKSPVFPFVINQRSMIYIDNLNAFIRLCIERELKGVYLPQNREYVSTMEMARNIALAMNKKIKFSYILGFAVYVLRLFFPFAKKGFGSLVYNDTDDFNYAYVVVDNEQSFKESIS